MPTKRHVPKIKPDLSYAWDRAATTVLTRINGAFGNEEPLDPGVNFFVLALEALGARTRHSCEGHPTGFYVSFVASYELAKEVSAAGYFSVEIIDDNVWAMRKTGTENGIPNYSEADKAQTLRWAAQAWIGAFGERLAGMDCLKEPN